MLLLDTCLLYLYLPLDWVGKYLDTYHNNVTHIYSAVSHDVYKYSLTLLTWPYRQCVPVALNIMGYLTRNLCYAVVTRDKVFYYQVRIQIKIQQTRVQQYDFMFTIIFTL